MNKRIAKKEHVERSAKTNPIKANQEDFSFTYNYETYSCVWVAFDVFLYNRRLRENKVILSKEIRG